MSCTAEFSCSSETPAAIGSAGKTSNVFIKEGGDGTSGFMRVASSTDAFPKMPMSRSSKASKEGDSAFGE